MMMKVSSFRHLRKKSCQLCRVVPDFIQVMMYRLSRSRKKQKRENNGQVLFHGYGLVRRF
jgi:hypothetical protein